LRRGATATLELVTAPDLQLVERLRAAGCVFAEDEARLLTEAAENPEELERLVARRVEGFPLEPLLGWAEFCGLRIVIEPGVFVPRHRTEFLVERAISLARPDAVVLDLCCGAGAIGAAIASRLGAAVQVYATEIEPAAVHCARINLEPRGHVFEGDLFDALPTSIRGRLDLIAVNAPYVPTESIAMMPPEARLHEPAVALDGGADGLGVHRRIAAAAPAWLAPGGTLLIETSRHQAPASAALFASAGLVSSVESSDAHDATLILATRPPVPAP
jgi:release factor glutamine methyltransferase